MNDLIWFIIITIKMILNNTLIILLSKWDTKYIYIYYYILFKLKNYGRKNKKINRSKIYTF